MVVRRLATHHYNFRGISHGRVQTILRNGLGMTKVSARSVPRLLIRNAVGSSSLMKMYVIFKHLDDFVEWFVTIDESWVHDYQPETNHQSKQWLISNVSSDKEGKVCSISLQGDSVGIPSRTLLVDYILKVETINSKINSMLICLGDCVKMFLKVYRSPRTQHPLTNLCRNAWPWLWTHIWYSNMKNQLSGKLCAND